MPTYYNLATVKQAILASNIDDSQTTLSVLTGHAALYIPTPCIAVMSIDRSLANLATAEHIELTSRVDDLYTIVREIVNSAQAHVAGTYLLGFWSPAHFEQITNNNTVVNAMLNQVLGRSKSEVVLRQPPSSELLVHEQAVPDMSVRVDPGMGFIDSDPFNKLLLTDLTLVAPSVSTRTDLVIVTLATMEATIVTGVEGGGTPATPSDAISIATIIITTSHTIIEDTDITDTRVF